MKILSALLLLFALQLQAAPPKTPAKPAKPPVTPAKPAAPADSFASADLDPSITLRLATFFKLLREADSRSAYDKLFDGSSLAAEQPTLIGDLIKTTTVVLEKCGKVESVSILRVRGAGKALKEIVCVVNCAKRPMRWKLYAYFGEGRWQIIDTNVSLELDSFFDPEKPGR